MSPLKEITPILPCFHPTTVAMMDDDSDFLEGLTRVLRFENKPHICFVDPVEGIEHLNQDTYRQDFLNRLVAFEEGNITEDTLVFRDQLILQEALNPKRFSQVSVLIIDYEMPRMRGLEVCERLNNPFIKKIMLTGEPDESIAIDAFNEGLIYQYVRKQKADFVEQLERIIKQAQREYFEEIFSIPMKILRERPESTALVEPKFVNYFNEIVQKNAIEEYYLVEPTGSFLMVDKNQKTHSLMTLDEGLVGDVSIRTRRRDFIEVPNPSHGRSKAGALLLQSFHSDSFFSRDEDHGKISPDSNRPQGNPEDLLLCFRKRLYPNGRSKSCFLEKYSRSWVNLSEFICFG